MHHGVQLLGFFFVLVQLLVQPQQAVVQAALLGAQRFVQGGVVQLGGGLAGVTRPALCKKFIGLPYN